MHHPWPQLRNFEDPDEVLALDHAAADTIQVGDLTIGRLVLQPGWRWSEHVRHTAGTDSCQFHHVGIGIFQLGVAHHGWKAYGTEPWFPGRSSRSF